MNGTEINWKSPVKNKDYVVIPELPENIQKPFEDWLTGKTRPVIEVENENMFECAYYSDYKKFSKTFQI